MTLVNTVGTHCVLELYGCDQRLLNDPTFIRDTLREASVEARSTLLGEVRHHFEPQGVTALALLAESHISIHTWPENGYAAVDVFTCGSHTRPELACDHIRRAVKATSYNLRSVPRGIGVPEGTFQVQRLPEGQPIAVETTPSLKVVSDGGC